MPNELHFELVVGQNVPVTSPDAVSYETGASPKQTRDESTFAYEHHGSEFDSVSPGALQRLYEDLLLGRALPLRFETRAIAGIDTLVAIAVFMHRDIAIHPSMPAFVATVDAAHRLGVAYAAHLDPPVERFLRLLRAYVIPDAPLSKNDVASRLTTALGWVRAYVTDGDLPHLGVLPPPPRVLDRGTNGFVVAQATGSLPEAWIDLYRSGHLRGVVVGPDTDGRRRVLAARKSQHLPFDLLRAATYLNEIERSMGEPPEWCADNLWLHGPKDGTTLLLSHIVEVFLRV